MIRSCYLTGANSFRVTNMGLNRSAPVLLMTLFVVGCRSPGRQDSSSSKPEAATTSGPPVPAVLVPLSATSRWVFDVAASFPDAGVGGVTMEATQAHRLVILRQRKSSALILALDAATGSPRYSEEGMKALVGARHIWFVSFDRSAREPKNISLRALDMPTGQPSTLALAPPFHADPSTQFALVGERLVATTRGALVAYDVATGRQRWSRNMTTNVVSELVALGDEAVMRTEDSAFVANRMHE